MQTTLNVIYEGVVDSKSVRSFVTKRIARCIESLGLSPRAQLTAHLRKEGNGHFVNCQIEIRHGTEIWRGSWIDDGLHRALIGCLDHLSPRRYPTALTPLQAVS